MSAALLINIIIVAWHGNYAVYILCYQNYTGYLGYKDEIGIAIYLQCN